MRLLPLALVTLLISVISAAKVEDECLMATSCGQCIKKGPQCAWCMDPASTLSSRCQKRSKLEASTQCMKDNIYQPVTGTEVPPTYQRIGEISPHNTTVYMEPQVVTMKVKMGEPMTAQFKYKHIRPANDAAAVNVQLQHSELPSALSIRFYLTCKGKRVETKKCADVPDGEMMDIEVQVTLRECSAVTGTQSFSVGVVGYRGVAGVYVNPLCGCECEITRFHEKVSSFCSRAGTLICGQCAACDAGLGGTQCECPLAKYGVKSYKELEDKCRESSTAPVCGGNGRCNCGKCQCDSNTVSGDFCSCDNTSCPVGGPDGRQCSGRGLCKCGACECEAGFEREDCSCEKATHACIENGKECGGNGHCECGKCVCDAGWTGAFCAASEGGVKSDKSTTKMKKEETTTSSSKEEEEAADPESDQSLQEEGATDAQSQAAAGSMLPAATVLLPLVLARFL